jgi:hypothetical protein
MSIIPTSIPEASEVNRAEFYRLGCVLLRLAILMVSEVTARAIGHRLEMFSQAAFVPSSDMHTDRFGIAGYLNMKESGSKTFANRNHVPSKKPGQNLLFRVCDLTETFEPDDADLDD